MRTSKTNILKTSLVFLLIAVSAMPLFKQQFATYLLLFGALLTLKNIRFGLDAILFVLLALALEIYHNFYFDNYDMVATRQVMILFISSMLIIYYVKLDLLPIYINILYFFSLISFVFFALWYADSGLITNLVKAVPGIFTKTSVNYGSEASQVNPIFYNFDANFTELGRNNGPFWEPTAFAIMLILAQMFNLFLTQKLFNKKGIVFTIAIFTTLSTTGILAYFLFVLSFYLFSPKLRKGFKLFMVTGILGASIGLFTTLPFLSEKILNEFEKADYEMDKYGGDSRLASAMMDMREISEDPTYILFGKGLDNNYRIAGPDKEVLRNCGDTSLLISWGAIFSLVYLSLLFYTFHELTKIFQVHRGHAVVFTVIFLILGFSEVFLTLPFFYAFLFLGFIIKKQYIVKETASDHNELAIG
jgi:hypothetical protein